MKRSHSWSDQRFFASSIVTPRDRRRAGLDRQQIPESGLRFWKFRAAVPSRDFFKNMGRATRPGADPWSRLILALKKLFHIDSEWLTLRRPWCRRLRMRWFFDISKVKESRFFKSDLTGPNQIIDAHLLETTDLSPSSFHFSVGFISRSCFASDGFLAYSKEWDWREKTMFIQTNEPLITSFYVKKVPIFAESAMIQRWSAIFCATGAWGGKPIGRVRVKVHKGFSSLAFWIFFQYFFKFTNVLMKSL